LFTKALRDILLSKYTKINYHGFRDTAGRENFYDYDNCEYSIVRDAQEEESKQPDVIKFGFSCNCFEAIMQNGGQEMLDEVYKDN